MKLLGVLSVLALAGPAWANPLLFREKRDDTTDAPATTTGTDTAAPATTGGTTSVAISSAVGPAPTTGAGPPAVGDGGITFDDIGNYAIPDHFQAVLMAVANWDFDWFKESVTQVDDYSVRYMMLGRDGSVQESTVAWSDIVDDDYKWPVTASDSLPWWPVGYVKAAVVLGYNLDDESDRSFIKSADALATVTRNGTEVAQVHLSADSDEYTVDADQAWDILERRSEAPMVITVLSDEGDPELFPPYQMVVKSVSGTGDSREVTLIGEHWSVDIPPEGVTEKFVDLFDKIGQMMYTVGQN